MTQDELEQRLILFAVSIVALCDSLPNSRSGSILGNQLVRSATSTALNYGEARGAESEKDYIHKLHIVLKELRESYISLQIIEQAKIADTANSLKPILNENNELISIFVASLKKLKLKTR
jgi:four helix bundle protein